MPFDTEYVAGSFDLSLPVTVVRAQDGRGGGDVAAST